MKLCDYYGCGKVADFVCVNDGFPWETGNGACKKHLADLLYPCTKHVTRVVRADTEEAKALLASVAGYE